MSSAPFEAFLARIYVDGKARREFFADPAGEAERAGLSPEETRALENTDWVGLELAGRSFERKRLRYARGKSRFARLFGRTKR